MEKPNIRVEEVEIKIIYIRFRGSYLEFRKNSMKMFRELFEFAKSNDLIISEVSKVITVYHDNPFITHGENLRTSVAMTVPCEAVIVEEGQISVTSIVGKFGIGSFYISRNEYGEAWGYMYENWLFAGEAKARDAVPFELYVTEPPKNARDKSYTEIYIPIE